MYTDLLRQQPLFSGLSDADMVRLHEVSEAVALAPGDVLVREGDVGDCMYVILEGHVEVTKQAAERELVIAARGPGDVIGELGLVEGRPRTATVRAVEPGKALKITRPVFEQLLVSTPGAGLRVLGTISDRLRDTERALRQREKMASLGTLAAGLAHEMNNPAAAIARNASQMNEALAEVEEALAELAACGMDAAQAEAVDGLRLQLAERARQPVRLDPIERSELEADVASVLEVEGLVDAWEHAPALAALGWDAAALLRLAAPFSSEQRRSLYHWLAAAGNARLLLQEVRDAADRISDIVRAIKSYAYLDQAPVQLVDLHEGIENTLVILQHELGGVTIVRDYAPDLPRIEAHGSELNQVWTYIIDNAIKAVNGHGVLTIRTRTAVDAVVVQITDDGPGIPPEAQGRVFDAFFTTRPLGEGAGLGLHIAYNIVVAQHRGDIRFSSEPGRTTFTVTLPRELERK